MFYHAKVEGPRQQLVKVRKGMRESCAIYV
jgi:hypothetical protein